MKLHEYAGYDALGLADLVRKREVSPIELIRVAREAHDLLNPIVNAVAEFYDDAEMVAASDIGPFCGVPFLRKDSGPSEAGRLQEHGSRLYRGFRPSISSLFVDRARASGLRILGRTTLPEFGTTGLSESSACGITRNPWDLERTAGGSSSGSAAAVAAGIVPIAGGGDGGGSIRIPSANCGLVGFIPSRGRISGAPSHQDVGFGSVRNFVICRSVRDMASALDAFAGSHPGDPFTIIPPLRPYGAELRMQTGKLLVGLATSAWGGTDVGPEILDAVKSTGRQLETMGHIVEEMNPPYLSTDYRKVVGGMFHIGFSSLDGTAQTLGREINEETVEPVNLELYQAAKRLPLSYAHEIFEGARKIRVNVGEATDKFDILVTPTMPCLPLFHGTYSTTNKELTANQLLDADAALYQYLGVFNITGQPAVSLPLFQSREGLPIGIQIVGRFADEATLVRVARDLEEAVPWSPRKPSFFAGASQQNAKGQLHTIF
ncbi:aspartyl-tRNA(Asn) amidotransferase subunit A Glutamyl-tRNA(Gln) amidotransferase subunit A (plasmid) [Sinorhizobium americanum CCGM7]|uniref:amidase n=1 Tax=Sinorhizobium americanum TaxID=194963 RepID=UPI0004D870ED|nr:amidase [Sinorhizobium americanum]APG86934.1 aspartyl-tRNA(Asn) amidotransferase subunit A Glutamyl-tRNA(Gln) amidotransferase subunit A [Sinorhizobium americanum CCGM7]